MLATRVVKRTGEVVNFDEGRIRNAIVKAVRATGKEAEVTDERLDALVDRIREEIDGRFTEFFPNVENIQDIVEKHLVLDGLYEIGKAYILYRAERQGLRQQAKQRAIEDARLGKLTVVKRDGRTALFNAKKIEDAVVRAADGLDGAISPDLLLKEVLNNVHDQIPADHIERAMVLAAAAFIERDPAYSYLAARLLLQKLYKEVIGRSTRGDDLDRAYREGFTNAIRRGVSRGNFDPEMLNFDLPLLAASLKPERDRLFQYLGIQTLYDRYFVRAGEQVIELPQGFWMRVAMGLAIQEDDRNERALEFYDLMSNLHYVPSTPTLFHAGTSHPQLSSCYLTTIKDDLRDIFKGLADNAQLSKWSGGIGNDWSNIRGTGSHIHSTHVESQGVIPFLKIANDVTNAINRSGKRRGATCAYLETWHYDIEDFLDLRKNTGDERRRTHDMNTANWIPDLFMKRVLADEQWTLFSPDDTPDLHHLYGHAFEARYEEYERAVMRGEIRLFKQMPAKALWRKMLTMLYETGHPWITFKDPCNIRSPQDHVGVVHSSNLCTEITLNTSSDETAVCNLGSINLGRHVRDGHLDAELLARTVRTAIRMLDNVVDVNYYPTEEAKSSNLRHRPIGLGLMGFQDALYQLDLAFESEAALEFCDEMMELVSFHAISASCELAAERGAYASFRGSKWDRGLFPFDTVDLLEQERGVPVEVSRKQRLDWRELQGPRRAARHAQLQHHGSGAHRHDLQHLRLLPLHRADLQEHLRQGQHLGRVHRRQRVPGGGPAAARAVEPGDARAAQVPRRQRAADLHRAGGAQGQVQGGLRGRPHLGAAPHRRARQVDRPEPVAQRLHARRLGQAAARHLRRRLALRAQDHLLPAHPGGVADREVDPRRRQVRLHPEAPAGGDHHRGGGAARRHGRRRRHARDLRRRWRRRRGGGGGADGGRAAHRRPGRRGAAQALPHRRPRVRGVPVRTTPTTNPTCRGRAEAAR